MSSIWSSGAAAAGASPFATTGMAPTPGNGSANRFASMLHGHGGPAAQQAGLSPKAAASAQKAQPADAADTSSGSSDDSGATITANDFLTLLVTEMQNQDPTADNDPNAYIDQLVQVNSLEQLISINQNLSTVLGTSSTSAGASTTTAAAGSSSHASPQPGLAGAGASGTSADASTASAQAHARASGNLSLPHPSAASRVVAHSLDGHTRAAAGHAVRDIQTRALPH